MKTILFICLLPLCALCGELKPKWSTSFNGSLDGETPIHLLLFRSSDNSITGSYYNSDELLRHHIKGYVNGNKVIFEEIKGDKKIASFKGSLSDDEKPTLTGAYEKDGKSYNAKLSYVIHFPAKPGKNLYDAICAESTTAVEEFATKVKAAILNGNKEEVAQYVHYTLEVTLGEKYIRIKSPEEFLKRYNEIFTEEFLKSIKSNCIPMNMTNSYKGVWFGFNKELIIQMMRKGDGPFQLKIGEINNSLAQ